MKRSLLRRDKLKSSDVHKLSKLERCIYCEYCWGFRNKIPQCKAEKCIFEDIDCLDE